MKTAKRICLLLFASLIMTQSAFLSRAHTSDYSQISLTEEEKILVAALCRYETANEPLLSKVSFCAMILNRLQSKYFPDSIRNIIFDGGAFESAMSGKLSAPPSKEELKTELLALEYTLMKNIDPTCGSLFTMNTNDPHLWEIKVRFTVSERAFGVVE